MRVIIAAVMVICMIAGTAGAISERAACIKDARATKTAAMRAANTEFKNAVKACDGPCYSLCRSDYLACRQPLVATQESCLKAAEDNFTVAFDACKALVGCGTNPLCAKNAVFQQCMAPARVVRNTAVQACNRTANRALKGCADTLKACNRNCKHPAPTPTQTPTPLPTATVVP